MTSDSAQPIKQAAFDRSKPIAWAVMLGNGNTYDVYTLFDEAEAISSIVPGSRVEPLVPLTKAAAEIERLRTIMYRIVDEDCTVAIQGGTFYADDEPLFAVPCTHPAQPTPGECSTQEERTSPEWMQRPFLVDPPQGWRYGFPKRYDPATDGNMTAWMIANGYPERLAKQGLHCTFTACAE